MNIMKRATILGIVLGPLAACAGGPRFPSDTVALVTPLALGPPPIYALIGHRQELELTSQQITALDAIAQQVEEQNEPLIEELHQMSMPRSRQRGQLVVGPDGEPLLDRIRQNQRTASEAVAALLNEEQRASVCRLYEKPGERREVDVQERQRERRDTVAEPRSLRPAGWHWCSEEEEGQVVS